MTLSDDFRQYALTLDPAILNSIHAQLQPYDADVLVRVGRPNFVLFIDTTSRDVVHIVHQAMSEVEDHQTFFINAQKGMWKNSFEYTVYRFSPHMSVDSELPTEILREIQSYSPYMYDRLLSLTVRFISRGDWVRYG